MLEAGENVVGTIAKEVASAKVDLDKVRNDLNGRLAPMTSAFQGQAGTAFKNLQLKWEDKVRNITDALNEFEAALQHTDSTNVQADTDQGMTFGKLGDRMG